MGVTDHSEYVGVTKAANTPGSAVSKLPEAQRLTVHDPNNKQKIQKASRRPLELEGHSAQGRQRAAGYFAQCEYERRLDVSYRRRQPGPSDRCGLSSAARRNERLVEIKQIKGQSETRPLLSPNDEFDNYELFGFLMIYNPYKFGMAGGSDSHNSAAAYRQDDFFGGHAQADGTAQVRMAGHGFMGLEVRLLNPAGLTGVWAEENTRASIWDAMYRMETFGVSGPHIKVRLFGGWEYTKDILNGKEWVKRSYAGGVPMGGNLPPMKSKAPAFVIWAVKDPTSGNLDRIQIIKGWSKSGQSFEKIFDVVWWGPRKADKCTGKVPPIQSTVDIENATYTNTVGSVELKTVWTDPEFDSQSACVLLCSRAGNPDASLDDHSGPSARHCDSGHGSPDDSGACLELADLVHVGNIVIGCFLPCIS